MQFERCDIKSCNKILIVSYLWTMWTFTAWKYELSSTYKVWVLLTWLYSPQCLSLYSFTSGIRLDQGISYLVEGWFQKQNITSWGWAAPSSVKLEVIVKVEVKVSSWSILSWVLRVLFMSRVCAFVHGSSWNLKLKLPR